MKLPSIAILLIVEGSNAFVASPKFASRTNVTPLSISIVDQTQTSQTTSDDNVPAPYELLSRPARPGRPLKVAIAGGGVGGLTAALYMLKNGFDVTVYEKTAAFARFGGPIQFASNALSVLKEIDETLFDRVMEKFTFTGEEVFFFALSSRNIDVLFYSARDLYFDPINFGEAYCMIPYISNSLF